jgi:nitroreductase
MELREALLERRSVRQFEERAVEMELLRELLLAGIWAPTAGNIQPWVFICVTDPDRIHTIQVVSPGMLGNPRALICVCSDQRLAFEKAGRGGSSMARFDCAMAAQNIMLRAFDLGLATCVIRSFNPSAVGELLSAPEHVEVELLINIGYPFRNPPKPPRREDVIFWERYGRNAGEGDE